MWHVSEPTGQFLRDFVERQQREPFSYREVGASRDGRPPGYHIDHNRTRLGEGDEVFETACNALRRWAMFPRPWTRIDPADTPVEPGRVVASTIHVFALWWTNACRIVYVVDETRPVRRFGFAYGTLREHVECGEERFSIEQDDDGGVWYDLRAFSRPRYWLARIGHPLVRQLQRRFARDSLAAMRRAVTLL